MTFYKCRKCQMQTLPTLISSWKKRRFSGDMVAKGAISLICEFKYTFKISQQCILCLKTAHRYLEEKEGANEDVGHIDDTKEDTDETEDQRLNAHVVAVDGIVIGKRCQCRS